MSVVSVRVLLIFLDKINNKQHAPTWGQGQPDSAGHRIAEGTLHPAGQDGQQQAGDTAQALAACEALAPRAGNRGVNEDVFLCLP